jgi:hypothetical protein
MTYAESYIVLIRGSEVCVPQDLWWEATSVESASFLHSQRFQTIFVSRTSPIL